MKPVNVHCCVWILAMVAILSGCQADVPPSPQDDIEIAGEMKSWFEATDHEASGYSSLEEALEDIYQDEGYTVSLYHELEELVNKAGTSGSAYDGTFIKCQEWFEMIDHESSGYDSLEEAIEDIYQDEGETLDLYRKLTRRNAKRGS